MPAVSEQWSYLCDNCRRRQYVANEATVPLLQLLQVPVYLEGMEGVRRAAKNYIAAKLFPEALTGAKLICIRGHSGTQVEELTTPSLPRRLLFNII